MHKRSAWKPIPLLGHASAVRTSQTYAGQRHKKHDHSNVALSTGHGAVASPLDSSPSTPQGKQAMVASPSPHLPCKYLARRCIRCWNASLVSMSLPECLSGCQRNINSLKCRRFHSKA